jgi:hypothetical protein
VFESSPASVRPETVESIFYMYRFTHNDMYRDWGWELAEAFEQECRVEGGGYSQLSDVTFSMKPGAGSVGQSYGSSDSIMQSFFLAETLKYLYLLFSDDDVIPLDKYVFNTEAHPLSVRGHGKRKDPSKWTSLKPFFPITEHPVKPSPLASFYQRAQSKFSSKSSSSSGGGSTSDGSTSSSQTAAVRQKNL